MKMLQLRICLEDVEPLIWRRFLMPAHATFGELNQVILILMRRRDYHLHEFYLDEEKIGMKDEDSPSVEHPTPEVSWDTWKTIRFQQKKL